MLKNNFLYKDIASAVHFSKTLSVICMILIHAFSYSCSFSDHIDSCLNESTLIGFFMGMTSNFLITSGLSIAIKQFGDEKNHFRQIVTFSCFLIVLDFFSQLTLGIGAEGFKYGSSILTIGVSTIAIVALGKVNLYLIPLAAVLSGLLGNLFRSDIFSFIPIVNSLNDFSFNLLGIFQVLCFLLIINICLLVILRHFKFFNNPIYFFSQFIILCLIVFPNIQSSNFKLLFIRLLWGSPNDNILFPFLFWFPRVALGWCLFFLIKELFQAKFTTRLGFIFILTLIYFLFPYFSGRMDIKLFSSSSINLWDSEFNSNITIRLVILSILFNVLVLLIGNIVTLASSRLAIILQKISSISLYLYIFIGSNIHKVIFSIFQINTFYSRALSLLLFYSLLALLLMRVQDFISRKSLNIKVKKLKTF